MQTLLKMEFQPESPVLKYHQKSSNSCCLSILSLAFHIIGGNRVVPALVNRIEESLTFYINRFSNTIDFANDITKKQLRHIGEQHLRYNL